MKPTHLVLLLLLLWAVVGCRQPGNRSGGSGDGYMHHAGGLTVEKQESCTRIRIRDPWDTTRILQQYLLVREGVPAPEVLPDEVLVRIPLKRVVVATTVHCSILELLGVRDAIAGVCEGRYVALDFIREGLASGAVTDIGEATTPDVEKLIALHPDAFITSPLNNVSGGRVEKTGIPQIKCVDYMESLPLGRAEWIRLFGLFFDKEAVADSLFREREKTYRETAALVKGISRRPTVLPEMKYGPVWYVPGGESYMAHLLEDAGAAYFYAEDTHSGSLARSFEEVFETCRTADFWLIKYHRPQDLSYGDLKKEYEPYSYFDAYKKQHIFGCNSARVPYYEESPLYPDLLLKDFVAIFHPDLLPGYQNRYYLEMGE